MSKYLTMTIPALLFSYFMFYFIYQKIGIQKFISNKKSKQILGIIIVFIVYIVGFSIVDSLKVTKVYHDVFIGLYMGPFLSLIPITISVKPKSKE